jgi:hypothetical protein
MQRRLETAASAINAFLELRSRTGKMQDAMRCETYMNACEDEWETRKPKTNGNMNA